MCNALHNDYKPIPEKGTGWKLFEIKGQEICQWIHKDKYISDIPLHKGGIVSWQGNENEGFCFFNDKETARYIANSIGIGKLLEIEYGGGMGEHMETKLKTNEEIKIALCKSFRLKGK